MNQTQEIDRAALVKSVDAWIRKQVKRYVVPLMGWQHYDDACQEGRIGAWRASKSWRPDGGATFLSYSRKAIGFAIKLYTDREMKVSSRVYFGDFPRGVDPDSLGDTAREKLSNKARAFSKEPDPADAVEKRDRTAYLRKAVERMASGEGRYPGYKGDRRRKVLEMRFGLVDGHRYTLEECGRVLGVCRSRVNQDERKAVAELAEVLDPEAVL